MKRKPEHPTQLIKIDGKSIAVDCEMAGLIRQLNKLGLKTTACCEGDKIHRYSQSNFAYVSIQLDENQHFEYDLEQNQITIRWNRSQRKYLPTDSFVHKDGWVYQIPEVIKRVGKIV